ncbi:hypothetical protein CERSUDRAFT_138631 [Gelatoporia subvermispora B]|uniref:Aminoglycoside phosphotransferase domain-containing protein n=1 Tax=Ceriporiopsis subvermispora (strain B) TaxID=914234 RepID=M2PIC3_CERS8|nr:hypothetical protein CERSUDRAFT_138631 [Gelatoporia subvermispora B]
MILACIFEFIIILCGIYERHWFGRHGGGYVKFLPFGLVMKFNKTHGADEADIIAFVRKNTAIPVPRVLLQTRGFGRAYFLMKRVDGEALNSVWHKLDPDQKASVVPQLRLCVEQLRALQPPSSGTVCGLSNAALVDSRISSSPVGPFRNEHDFNDHLIKAASIYVDGTLLRDVRARMHDSHRIVFTHGDLAPRNIIVRRDKVAAIIDWEGAGWYPEHWELVKALYNPMMRDDESWNTAIREILPRGYEKDCEVDRQLSDRMVGAF